MRKLIFSNNKTLKLTNVLKKEIIFNEKVDSFEAHIQQMKIYISNKGTLQVGPLIQYTETFINEENAINMKVFMMIQCNDYLNNVDKSYQSDQIIKIKDCLYCRYIGPEENLKFAYEKINLEAFENDISLKGNSYTIYVEHNVQESTIIADVFMPRDI